MADIVIVGGGLTGLAAAWELETLGADYTLIEVKDRLGGSMLTERRAGFVFDGGGFIHEKYSAWTFLDELGLPDALEKVGIYRDGELVIFRDGTQTLTDALAGCITHPVMRRMAVSSAAQQGERFGVCLENGLLLDARAVIIAAPARYAGHMLRWLPVELSTYLLDYTYDPIVRVSLGFRADDLCGFTPPPHQPAIKFMERSDSPSRVPPGHVMVRVGVRLGAEHGLLSEQDAEAKALSLFPAAPVAVWTRYWAESDPLTRYLPEHPDLLDAIERALPSNMALVGSDYRSWRLDQLIEQGRSAARKVISRQ